MVPPLRYIPSTESSPASALFGLAYAYTFPLFMISFPFESIASPSSASTDTDANKELTSIFKSFLTVSALLFAVVVFRQSSSAYIS